ncbi:MAG: ribonuclease P protein component [Planctomycetota bacterium]
MIGERFPRSSRICKSQDFERVFKQGRRARSSHMHVVAAPNDLDIARLGLAVSRRVGNAVVRNRVKRRIREIFRRNRAALPVADLVVIPFASFAQLDFAAMRTELLRLAERAAASVAKTSKPRES